MFRTYEVPITYKGQKEENYLEVEFEAYPRNEDAGIGGYEFWGSKEYDSRPYMSCEYHGIEWKREKYTDEENKAIEEWLVKNEEMVDEEFCKEWKQNNEPDFD